jgi:glycosyltransferase involved in cell wall biosynthesis
MKITIITPSLNQSSTLEQTIESVLAQRSFADVQYIVVDGNSTDGSRDILERYRNQIDTLIIEDDRSQSNALNKAFNIASGPVLGWVNSDDYLKPLALKHVLASIREYPAAAAWVGSTEVIEVEKSYICSPFICESGIIGNWSDQSHFFQPSCFFSRSHFLKAGPYVREDLKCVFDVELWMRLIMLGKFACFPDNVISSARVYPEAITQAFPLRREIEFVFINYLHYGFDSAMRRLEKSSELIHYSLDMPEISGRYLARAATMKAWLRFKRLGLHNLIRFDNCRY